MNAKGPDREGRAPRRIPTIVVLGVVGLLFLLPASVVSFSALNVSAGPAAGTPSGLSPAWDKTVDFVESGLAAATTWSVNLSGTTSSSNTNTIAFSILPGNYAYNVTPVPGYTATPSSGSFKLSTCSNGLTIKIKFTPVPVSKYTVFFNETGLPPGTPWWVDFDGMNTSASVASISFSAPNATYTFTDPGVVAGPVGVQFVTAVSNGTVTVHGANVVIDIPYSAQYYLTMIAYPPGGGTVSPSSGWFAAGASVDLSAVPATGFGFLNWSGMGTGNYTGTSATPTIVMNGPIVENATFGLEYAVDFEETGLPDGTIWSVTFDGITQSSFFVFLDFSATNGTFDYTVAPIPGYHADSYTGQVTVKGGDVTVLIQWVRVTYNVTFEESGLPTGTTWSVTLNGSSGSNLTPTAVVFAVPNGTLPWTVGPISGFTANVSGGTVDVAGADVVIQIAWTAATGPSPTVYTVTFVETGLPSGTPWSVHLNNTTSVLASSSTTHAMFVGVGAGSYVYWVPNVGSYSPASSTGAIIVSDSNVTIDVTFTSLGPASLPPPSTAISEWELVIIAFIVVAAALIGYVLYRRR